MIKPLHYLIFAALSLCSLINLSAQPYTTAQDGDFNDGSTWVGGVVPPNSPTTELIINHDVVLDTNIDILRIQINSPDGSLTDTGSFILTINNNGGITNNGVFELTSSTIQFDADATVDGTNPRIFNNVNLFNFGLVDGVNFGSQSTINGTLTINQTAFVDTGSPIYGPNSTLIYNNGGFYDRTSEWSNTSANQGNPHHVIINPGTELNLGSENKGNPAVMNGNLTIESGGSIYMDVGTGPGSDDMENPLIVGGNFINEGTIILSDLAGGDLVVEGHYTDNGNVDFNGRAVIFQGGADQELTGDASSGSYQMDVVRINKPSGEVIIQQSTEINKTNDPLILSNEGILNINNHNLILGEPGTSSQVTFNQNSALKGSNTSSLTLKGAGNMGDFVFDDSNDGISNSLGNIYIERDTGATIGIDNTLYLKQGISLTSGILNSNGNLVFVSDATNTAVVREVPSPGGSISDDVVIQRHFPLSNRSFRYISSSVNTTTSIHTNWQEGASNAMTEDPYTDPDFNPNPNFGTHITGSPGQVGTVDVNGLDRTQSGYRSLYTFDETNQSNPWYAITDTKGTNLQAGTPYALMVRGDRSATLESNTAIGSNPATLRTTGTIVTGDISPSFSSVNENDFVFVGNPYQAQVDMNVVLDGVNSTDLNTNYIWIWDPNIGTIGGYAVVDLSTGDADEVDIDGNSLPQSSEANEYLQPFQACFLEVIDDIPLGPTPSITFVESAKRSGVDESTNVGTFSDSQALNSGIEIKLYRAGNQNVFDAVRLRFSDGFNTTPTFEDAKKFWNSTERLSIINENTYLSIDKRKTPETNDTIPLYIGNYQANQYSFKLDANFDDGLAAYLFDSYLNQNTSIQNGINIYYFSIDTNIPESFANDRFALIFKPKTLSTDDVLENDLLSVYPNPTSDFLSIHIPNRLIGESADIKLFDLSGRLVQNSKINLLSKKNILNLSQQSVGLYILEVKTKGESQHFKLLVER